MAKMHPSASLYVGDLLPDVPEGHLYEVFNNVGAVASIRVCRDNITRRSLGYAYVNFHNAQDAERALDTLNNMPIKEKPCRIMWVNRDPTMRRSGVGNIFIKNLDPQFKHKELYDTFSDFGNILSVKVALDKNGQSKGYGFVHFDNAQNAQKAIDALNDKQLGTKRVYVGKFRSRKENLKMLETSWTNVYVKDLSPEVTDADLKQKFAEACDNDPSHITSCVVMSKPDGSSKGFGFVNYDNHPYAQKAVETLNGTILKGKAIWCGRHQKKAERQQELKKKANQFRMSNISQYQGRNLYVKNLEEDITQERFHKEFSAFGNILSCLLAVNAQTGISRGFGFVCYSTPEEAARALSEMNGHQLPGCEKPLYVAYHEPAEVRKQKLALLHMRPPYQQWQSGYQNQSYGPPPPVIHRQYPPTSGYQGGAPRRGGPTGGAGRSGNPRGHTRPNQGMNPRHSNQRQTPVQIQDPSIIHAQMQQPRLGQLTLEQLLTMKPDDQRQALGERLYRAIGKFQPDQQVCGKITGMLTYSSIPVEDLYALLIDETKLRSQINEALELLQSQPPQDGPQK